MNKQSGIAEESASRSIPSAQADIELRPVENSDQPILANFAAVQAAPGMVFLDFGFLDPQAINSFARIASTGNAGRETIRGRLACRVALPVDTVANLARQLNQLLQPRIHEPADQAHQAGGLETAAKETSLH